MTLYTSVLTAGSNNFTTTSEHLNNTAKDFFSSGFVGALGLNTGSGGTGSFAISASATPDANIQIAAGVAYLSVTPTGQRSQRLRVEAQTAGPKAIASNSTGSTKYDWIYISLDPAAATTPSADSTSVASIYSSRSTSNTSDTGTPPTAGLLIGIITVANGFSSIANGAVADKRTGSAITAPSTNPCNFRVYLTSAQNTINGFTRLLADTKSYDTGSNVDIVTNKGRFIAPIAGFYRFNGSVNIATGASFTSVALYKNGVLASQGSQHASSAINSSEVVADSLQLAAGDYVELFVGAGAAVALTTGTAYSYFSGHLISTT